MSKSKYLVLLMTLLIGMSFSVNTAQAVPPAVKAKSEYLLADKLLHEGKPEQAIEHAEKAKTILGKTNSRIEYLLTKAYFKSGKFDKAMAANESFFGITPESESASEQYSEMVALYSQIELANKNSKIEMAQVPGGCFQMGGGAQEKPVHKVCVSSFQIGKYEVTQGQWVLVMGVNPSKFKKGDNYPVEDVRWRDVQAFIRKLNDKTGKNYRLPTEAEWEYAARSGGKKEKYSGGSSVDAVAWHKDNSGKKTHPVGQKRSNGLGIYDMSGNVWEWCQDRYDRDYYYNSPRDNPRGPSSGYSRVIRGGAYFHPAGLATATFRNEAEPDLTRYALGFRLVLPAGQ